MNQRSLLGLGLTLICLTLGCAIEQPQGGGRIHTRCRVVDGDASAVYPCAAGQYPLCVLGTDAGNGEVTALCCNNNETEAACARSAGIASDGGVTNQ